MLDDKLFQFFASDPLDPLHNVLEVFGDSLNPQHELLVSALHQLDRKYIEKIKGDPHYLHLMNKNNPMGEDIEAGLWYLIKYLHTEIPRRRMQIYLSQKETNRPQPYDHDALEDLELNQEMLVPLSQFEIKGTALSRNGFSFSISPIVEASNSSYWLLNYLSRSEVRDKLWVRLDPFTCRKDEEYISLEYRMWVFGLPLDWDKLSNLKEQLTGQWIPDTLSNKGIEITDFVWSPYGKELHFTCEELQKPDYCEIRGSRYLHSIYDKNNQEIVHLDGALRILDSDSWKIRRSTHISKDAVRKIGKRIKLFQIDGPISIDQFSGIAASFFVWNQDVVDYFTRDKKSSA
jgi:hypothetical protein